MTPDDILRALNARYDHVSLQARWLWGSPDPGWYYDLYVRIYPLAPEFSYAQLHCGNRDPACALFDAAQVLL